MNLGVWRFRLFAFTVYLAPVDLHRSAGGFRRQVFVGLGKRHVVNSYRGTEMSGGFDVRWVRNVSALQVGLRARKAGML